MKTLMVFLIPLLLSNPAPAQSCLPEGIVFNTQAQIDNFSSSYPGCTRIDGDVIISGYTICNLNGLSVLSSIGGDLKIECNESLTNTTGLSGLIRLDGSLYVCGNTAMTCLSGLEHLASTGGDLWVVNNPAMTCLNGLQGLQTIEGMLWIDDNDALLNFTGLENLAAVYGTIRIYSNNCITSLQGLSGLQLIGGSLVIGGYGHLGSLGNSSLTDLSALSGLGSIAGGIEIGYNESLPDLNGLENIQASSIGELNIVNNENLSDCAVQSICDYLASPGSVVTIKDNASGCATVEEVSEACALLNLEVTTGLPAMVFFPNPTSGRLTITIRSIHLPVDAMIISSNGKVVLQVELNNQQTTIDTGSLPPGVYSCIIGCKEKEITGQFILQ